MKPNYRLHDGADQGRTTTSVLQFVEVGLLFDRKSRQYTWHIVVENGKQAKVTTATNTVSVNLGEIHPAVVGDEQQAVVITGRARRNDRRQERSRSSQSPT